MLSHRRVTPSFWTVTGLVALIVAQISCSPQPSGFSRSNLTHQHAEVVSSDSQAGAIVIEPNPLDLGILNAGQAAKATLALRNMLDKTLGLFWNSPK